MASTARPPATAAGAGGERAESATAPESDPADPRAAGAAARTISRGGGIRVHAGRGQVDVDWDAAPGAAGYLVHRADGDGPYRVVDHRGGDLLAVPGPPYADTTVEPGRTVRYAVRPVYDPDRPDEAPLGRESAPVAARDDGDAVVEVAVDVARAAGPVHRPWRDMIGSEHLSLLLGTDRVGGEPMGAGLAAALSRVHRELGVRRVRAHGILGDDLGVYREEDGRPVHDFSGVDAVLDSLAPTGLRPVLELSFVPRALARDPSRVVTAAGVSSPPRDWDRWARLVGDLVRHLRARVGDAELRRWAVEVWNEPDLECFWTGTREEYLRMYDVTARAVREACPGLPVGGPATAATKWIEPFLDHVDASGAPLDFLSTHVYGSPPLDLRPALERHGRDGTPLLWTEWGPSPTHFAPVNDSVLSAAFLATGMRAAAGRVDALACWVASDHFEELGRPPALVHGGFGLLSVGNLAKPRFWALWMLEQLGAAELPARITGDGADTLVRAWPSIDPETGRVAVVVWNGTLDQGVLGRPEQRRRLERTVRIRLGGLGRGAYLLRHRRVDDETSNLTATARRLGVDGWPTEEQWRALRAADTLADASPPVTVTPDDGRLTLSSTLPMPSLSLLELTPR
ncbi:GH39 family glycosyl hydrolase [Micromonospora musae]|uniref:Xylan 1,4-beta-xylosidase n=1 Tax=Micromonospora musae TaxID=1894970 RepID=A0A3A9YI50_9ACTN|nr:xylan 1,4-beta-xylosidase [Micromonospora musae]RKN36373.1 xylan 1,4-beta-xylosidase [Micromonospora musae]